MAETWNYLYQNISFNTAGSIILIGLWNGDATKILKIKRIGINAIGTSAVTGTMLTGKVSRYTGITAWTPASTSGVSTALSTANAALGTLTQGTGGTVTATGTEQILRYFAFPNEEIINSGASLGSIMAAPKLGVIWECGYGEPQMELLTLRQNQGVFVIQTGGLAAQTADFWVEFTNN